MNERELQEVAAAYGRLEGLLQELFGLTIGRLCADCPVTCCRADLCDETCGSLFLDAVRRVSRVPPEPYYSERDGWLGPTGCRLERGRPPVCYAFVCDSLYAVLPAYVSEVLQEVCAGLEDLYAEVDQGVDLHCLGPDALARLEASVLRGKMVALGARTQELLAAVKKGMAS